MGCDIYLFIEIKVDGKWRPLYCPHELLPDDRDYEVFGFLAGIRNRDFEPQFPSRGLPYDAWVPEEGQEEAYVGDHSFTHAYLDEIVDAPWKEAGLHQRYFYIFCNDVLPRLCSDTGILSTEEKKKIRILMGFDS